MTTPDEQHDARAGAPDRRARPPIAGPIGAFASRIYAWELGRRSRAFDAGKGVERVPIPVVSVGNLSVGGTGKTPMVAWICGHLLERGRTPMIAMRGYKSRDGVSDEQQEYADRFGERVQIVAQPDRAAGIRAHLAQRDGSPEPDVVVLDDGFQHRRLARQLDIVLIDATRPPTRDRLLPVGWLREPIEALGRAHAVVFTRCDRVGDEAVESLECTLREAAPHCVFARAAHAWRSLMVYDPGTPDDERSTACATTPTHQPLDWLSDTPVAVALGIGHPAAFIEQARAHGAVLVHQRIAPDHHAWPMRDQRALAQRARAAGARAVLTTPKDLTKLDRRVFAPLPIVVPELRMEFRSGEQELLALIERSLAV